MGIRSINAQVHTHKICVLGAFCNKPHSNKRHLFLGLNEATPWAPLKHTTAQKKVPCVSPPSRNRPFMWPRLVPHFNNRPRGNTGSYVVDTGVSLSTHTSPINSNPLGQLISCRARKWEGGQPGHDDDDVTAGNERRDCCRGETQRMSKQASGEAERTIHVHKSPICDFY